MFRDVNILSNTQGKSACTEIKSDFSILILTKSWIPIHTAIITVHEHPIQTFLSSQDLS